MIRKRRVCHVRSPRFLLPDENNMCTLGPFRLSKLGRNLVARMLGPTSCSGRLLLSPMIETLCTRPRPTNLKRLRTTLALGNLAL
jgi:hypothetical protein